MRKLTLLMLIVSMFTFVNASDDKMSITTVEGKTLTVIGTEDGLTIPEYKGKIIFLEFFGHRCPPCLKSISHYKKLQAKYQKNLAIVAIEVQGLEDKVVLPDQAEAMVEALRKKGLPVAYITFHDEGHGFRKGENIKKMLEAELYFYSKIFGFELPEKIEPIKIENLTS